MGGQLAGQKMGVDDDDGPGGARQAGSHAVAAYYCVVGMAKDAPGGTWRSPGDGHYVSLLLGAIPVGVGLVVSAEQAQIGFRAGLAAVALSRKVGAGGGPDLYIVAPMVESRLSPVRAAQCNGKTWISQRRRLRAADAGTLQPGFRRCPGLHNTDIRRSARPADPQPSMAGNRPPQRPLRSSTGPSA